MTTRKAAAGTGRPSVVRNRCSSSSPVMPTGIVASTSSQASRSSGVVDPPGPDRVDESADDAHPVAPEEHDQRERGRHVQADDEGEVRRLGRRDVEVGAQRPPTRAGTSTRVAEAGHREQFGDRPAGRRPRAPRGRSAAPGVLLGEGGGPTGGPAVTRWDRRTSTTNYCSRSGERRGPVEVRARWTSPARRARARDPRLSRRGRRPADAGAGAGRSRGGPGLHDGHDHPVATAREGRAAPRGRRPGLCLQPRRRSAGGAEHRRGAAHAEASGDRRRPRGCAGALRRRPPPEDEQLLADLLADSRPGAAPAADDVQGVQEGTDRSAPVPSVAAPGCEPAARRGRSPAGARAPARAGVRLLPAAMLVVAAGTGIVLASLGVLALAQVPGIAAAGDWSPAALRAREPLPSPVELAAGVAVLGLLGSALGHAVRAVRALVRADAACSAGHDTHGLVVVDDEVPDAFALPMLPWPVGARPRPAPRAGCAAASSSRRRCCGCSRPTSAGWCWRTRPPISPGTTTCTSSWPTSRPRRTPAAEDCRWRASRGRTCRRRGRGRRGGGPAPRRPRPGQGRAGAGGRLGQPHRCGGRASPPPTASSPTAPPPCWRPRPGRGARSPGLSCFSPP